MKTYKDYLNVEISKNGQILDSPVNFFVNALEEIGCVTHFSCGGHPKGFYIAFTCDYETALEISAAGYCAVEVISFDYFAIRLNEAGHELNCGGFTYEDRDNWLQSMSESWNENLLKDKQ